MKILVTNNTLGSMPGGSEWHAHELALAIQRKGHEVHAYSPSLGWFAHSLQNKGVRVFNYAPEGDYDLILASHLSTIDSMDRSKTTGRMIQICHGKFTSVGQPSSKVDYHVGVTEEIQDWLKEKGFESTVIYNGVDHEKFQDLGEGEGVLSLCQGNLANNLIEKACKIIGVEMTQMNKFKTYSYNLHTEIPKYHTVISLGRGAFEAMACNKRLIVADSRHYVSGEYVSADGIISLDNVAEVMKNNCSGRRTKQKYSLEDITQAIANSLSSENPGLRKYSKEHLNIDLQADKYLELVN